MDSLTDRQHSQTEAVRQTERSNNLEKDRQTGDRWSHTDRKDGYAQIDWETDRPIHTDTQHKWTHTLLCFFLFVELTCILGYFGFVCIQSESQY